MSISASTLPSIALDVDSAERRRAERFAVELQVEVSTADGLPLSSEITNISASGFRTRCPIQLAKGAKLGVRFHQGRRRRAIVAWQIGEDVGCRLLRPLDPAELAALIDA